jgi:hypothetical protein
LDALRKTAMSFCAPFYWSATVDGDLRILHNGTISYVNTGTQFLGITANHVYQAYLNDRQQYPDIECQFGGSTIYPEKYLVNRNPKMDLATFRCPEVFVAAGHKTHHEPLQWPPDTVRKGELVLYGGYPASLREMRPGEADFAFQSFTWALTDVTDRHIVMYIDFANLHWPGHSRVRINESLGGISGGPIFRLIEEPVTRFELVGFILEYLVKTETVRGRHASNVLPDGRIANQE